MLVCPVFPVALRFTDTVPYCQLWLHPRLEEARTKVRQTHREKRGWGQRDRTQSGVTEKSKDDLFLQHIQDLPQNTIYFISPQSITLSSSFLSECLFCVFYWLLHQHTNALGQRISHKTISDRRDGNDSDIERGICCSSLKWNIHSLDLLFISSFIHHYVQIYTLMLSGSAHGLKGEQPWWSVST